MDLDGRQVMQQIGVTAGGTRLAAANPVFILSARRPRP